MQQILGFIFSLLFHLFLIFIFIYQVRSNVEYKIPRKISYQVQLVKFKKAKSKVYQYKKAKIKLSSNKKIATVGTSKQKIKLSKEQLEALKRKKAEEEYRRTLASLKKEIQGKESKSKEELSSALAELKEEVEKEGSSQEGGLEVESFYRALVESKVKANFRYPDLRFGQVLNCKIKIEINEQNEIVEAKIIESSGDEVFDNLALRAVWDTQKVPLPPSFLKSRLLKEGLTLSFNSKELEENP